MEKCNSCINCFDRWVWINYLRVCGLCFKAIKTGPENMQVKTIGNQLLNINTSGYLLPFELITLLLLVAMISSITIAGRRA